MVGDRIPGTHERAGAYMMYNEVNGTERKKLKRQRRREIRHYLTEELRQQYKELKNWPEPRNIVGIDT